LNAHADSSTRIASHMQRIYAFANYAKYVEWSIE
jgi:hypothetical protein